MNTPNIVQEAMLRISDKLSNPPVPVMSQEDYELLSKTQKMYLVCNVIGCNNVVCTHGLVCMDHHIKMGL